MPSGTCISRPPGWGRNDLPEPTPVLSTDIMTIPEEQIPRARILMTIVGGNVVYAAADAG